MASKAQKYWCKTGDDVRQKRVELYLTQKAFWERIGITQSGGSRYELGRRLPESIAMLLQLAYGTDKEATTLLDALRKRDDTPIKRVIKRD